MRWLALALMLSGCGRYRDFTLPSLDGDYRGAFQISWQARPAPVLGRGQAGEWDSIDVLNPSVIRTREGYLNYYSGFDGRAWRTGLAASSDGLSWQKKGMILSGGDYMAGNGSVVRFRGALLYYYEAGRGESIELDHRAVLGLGPWMSWDERGVADPYVIEAGGQLYMYYLGMDRARRQRLGVAMSADGTRWHKLRSNPIMDMGDYGDFDERGLGEPAVWPFDGFYWMLYTGRSRTEQRRLGLAQSPDGVNWKKLPGQIMAGGQAWNSQVICDPSVIVEGRQIRVWFGGGDAARPDENIHGQIGYGVLDIARAGQR